MKAPGLEIPDEVTASFAPDEIPELEALGFAANRFTLKWPKIVQQYDTKKATLLGQGRPGTALNCGFSMAAVAAEAVSSVAKAGQ
jgi:hypothetical protein